MKRKLIYTCIFIVLISCLNQEWDNPFDENCPKETWTPSNFSATQEESSIVLNWEQPVTNISGFKIERKIEGESWANSTTVGANARSWEDSEIEDGKNHEYRLTALADENESNSVTTQLFPLLAPTLQTLEVTNVGTNSATLNGSVNANGDTAKVIFEYGTSSLYGDSIIAIPETVTGENVVSVSADLSILIPGTNYNVRLKTRSSIGITYGNNIIFKTNYLPPSAFTDSVTNITFNSATLYGSINPNDDLTYISFEYGTTDTYGQTVSASPNTASGNSLITVSADLLDLLPGRTYHFRIKSENSGGITYGEDLTFDALLNDADPNGPAGTFTDTRDFNVYKWVRIGEQVWMAENLAYLPSVSPPSVESDNESYYYVFGYFGNNVNDAKATDNYNIHGVLYNRYAAQNACPPGWHLPTDEEWEQLAQFISDDNGGYTKSNSTWYNVGTHLKNETGWLNNHNGTNDYVFSGLPSGFCNNGSFANNGYNSYWWTYTMPESGWGYSRGLNEDSRFSRYGSKFSSGLSIRCIRD